MAAAIPFPSPNILENLTNKGKQIGDVVEIFVVMFDCSEFNNIKIQFFGCVVKTKLTGGTINGDCEKCIQ